MYSFARSTAASYSAWVMFDSNALAGSAGRSPGTAGRGTGSASSSRARSIRRGRLRVGLVHLVRVVDERVHEDRDLVAEVVEHDQRVGDHQRHVGGADVVGVRLGQALDGAHEVVAEQAHRATGERRQALERRDPVAGQVIRDRPKRVARRRARGAPRPRAPRAGRPRAAAPPGGGSRGTTSGRSAGPARPTRAGTTGPRPRSFRNADTGVSMSSMKVCRSGITL